jgi:hypothetical protein
LLGSAVYRLIPLAIAAFSTHFPCFHWLAWGASILFMAYSEGYKGFQLHFSPRMVARALYLSDHPNALLSCSHRFSAWDISMRGGGGR